MKSILPAALLGLLISVSPANAVDLDQPEVSSFIDMMVEKHDFDREELRDILAAAEIKEKIIDLISRPAESLSLWAKSALGAPNDTSSSAKRTADAITNWLMTYSFFRLREPVPNASTG